MPIYGSEELCYNIYWGEVYEMKGEIRGIFRMAVLILAKEK